MVDGERRGTRTRSRDTARRCTRHGWNHVNI